MLWIIAGYHIHISLTVSIWTTLYGQVVYFLQTNKQSSLWHPYWVWYEVSLFLVYTRLLALNGEMYTEATHVYVPQCFNHDPNSMIYEVHNTMSMHFKLQLAFTLIISCGISLVLVYWWTENLVLIEYILPAIFSIMRGYSCTLYTIFHKTCTAWWYRHIVWVDVFCYSLIIDILFDISLLFPLKLSQ